MDLSGLDHNSLSFSFKFGWGLDGSGDHSNYHQLSKKHFTTKQVMSVCVSLRTLTVKDNKGEVIGWTSTVAGANKPQNVRPLALFPAKESSELLTEFVPMVESEVKEMQNEGVKLRVKIKGDARSKELLVQCTKCSMSMVDDKMMTTLFIDQT